MEHTGILQNISKHINLDDNEVSRFTSLLVRKEFKKNDIILKEGHQCSVINYVQQGALRAFHIDQDFDENIVMFAINDWWITDMYSFVTGKPAVMNIDALEDTIVLQLHRDDLGHLYNSVPKFEKFFRIVMQNAYIREQLRVIENLSMKACGFGIRLFVRENPQA